MQGTCCHVRRDQCRGPIIEAADLGVSESYWRLGSFVYHCQSVKEVGRDKKKDVNRCLYALKDQGLVELITTENANPQWKALAPGTGGLDKGGVDVDPTAICW